MKKKKKQNQTPTQEICFKGLWDGEKCQETRRGFGKVLEANTSRMKLTVCPGGSSCLLALHPVYD